MAERELAELKTQRASTKGCITRIKNFVEQKGDTLSAPELTCRLGILESYFKQLLSYQTSIEKHVPDDASEMKTRGELEDLYCATKSKLLALMDVTGGRKSSFSTDPHTQSIVVASTSANNLPKMRLPQFSGKYSEFPNFIGCFDKLVHRVETLSSLEKFNYLLSCLSGPALHTIKAYEVTEGNYVKALDHFKARYDNKYLIFQEHIIALFNLPKVKKNSAAELRKLIDTTNAHLSALQSVGRYENITNAIIIYLVNSKLDFDSQSTWEEQVKFGDLPSWKQASDTLSKRCQYLESRDAKLYSSEILNQTRHANNNKAKSVRSNSNTALATVHSSCAFCGQAGHTIYKCSKFTDLSVSERYNEVKKLALCINCLSKGHSVKRCSVRRCRVCSLSHHILLHKFARDNNVPSTSQSPNEQVILVESSQQIPDSHLLQNQPAGNTSLQTSYLPMVKGNHVFLATALVKIKDKFGSFHLARALLDSASQLNFITEDLAQRLKLRKNRVETGISGIGDTASKVKYSTQAVVQSRINNFETSLQVYILPIITGSQPERKILTDDWPIPVNIQLADPYFFQPQQVDLLIGADHFFKLLCVGQIKLNEELPTFQKTLFGWIVAGRCSQAYSSQRNYASLVCREDTEEYQDEALAKLVEKFWEDESVEAHWSKWTDEQIQCENFFKTTFDRLADGRFVVKLPFKDNPQQFLGRSLETAQNRFFSLEKRLIKNAELKRQYSEFLREYLQSNHMEPITLKDVPAVHYFMPHQCVLRPESSTTKLRVVFDASCRTSSQRSLNDLLMVGLAVQEDIFSIILRFRCYRYALTADISAMYRQIMVYPEDRNFQLILWRENPNEQLQVYRLKTVTYGTACAPFLATRCLVQLSQDILPTMPEISRVIQRDFYMDDLITGADTREEIHQIKEGVDKVLSSAQLKLRKWYSNDEQLLQEIPEADREKPLRINDFDIIKTLGIVWNPVDDEFRFYFKPKHRNKLKVTKRTVLACISRLFDPLGLVNPIVVKAKVFLQELWMLKLNWDESIPTELEFRWRDFMKTLDNLQDIEIPRQVLLPQNLTKSMEIHGFSDASTRAYGCCIYFRCVSYSGNIAVNLLTSKSKVAPIRTARSLPCLELCGALLLSRLLDKVRSSFPKSCDNIFLWTDSEIVLDWLSRPPSTWKTFVANRVSEIQKTTKDATWRHVDSKSNPADIISRGSSVSELTNSIWFSGPAFLQSETEFWPPIKTRHNIDNTPEKRKLKSVLTCTMSKEFLEQIYAYSDFTKNCRRFAMILRFINNLKSKRGKTPRTSGELSAAEIDNAFIRIIWRIQQDEFAVDISTLEVKGTLHPKSYLIKLSPFLEDSLGCKLLRVGGRLKNSDLPYDAKSPILLPRCNPFVESYIRFLHFKNFHAGPLALVSIMRQRCWVVNAREYARKVVRSCMHCFRYRPRLEHQIMGNLPEGRVKLSLPFSHCGVDFCGPFTTTFGIRGKRSCKSYVAVFVCFVTKAVHIEVVCDLSADAFIAALKRQWAEFRAAFLSQQYEKEIVTWCSNQGIEFHHSPPRAPHFGGIWEAAIKSAKGLLNRTFQGALLTFEELSTVTVQIEAVLNSRPITPLSSDPNDEEALTPAHFLNQAPLECFVEPCVSGQKISYFRRWQRISALMQHFWQRWSREYLSTLEDKFKWQTSNRNLSPGTLVLIHQDDLPPFKWRLGRILRSIPGYDGQIRVVQIKTQTGSILRPIHKVAPLPIEEV